MAFQDMAAELRGSVPKLPFSYTKTLINRAWNVIRNSNLWSFNLFESAWITPPMLNTGTVTATQGSASITFDPSVAVPAIAAWQTANPYVLFTQTQFRISAVGGIYNIIAYNPSTGVATLDRIFADAGGAGQSYMVYQVYYTPPMSDFLTWISVRNPQMFIDLILTSTRGEIDARDPQRSWFQFPTNVVPFGTDQRGAGTATPSATLGYPLYELWGQPVTPFVYQCYGIRKGTPLVNPTDTLPFSIGEDIVLARAREYAYEWAEANKSMEPRAIGPDFKFLMGKSHDEYMKLLTLYRKQDKELVNNWFSSRIPGLASFSFGIYNTISGVASPYSPI
jgi:hypothetical protein